MAFSNDLRTRQLQSAVLSGLSIGVVVLLIWWLDLFTFARLRLNDNYFISSEQSDEIVIIALDDDSLDRYGRTPARWSRDVYIDLLDNLAPANPRVVAFDLLFSDSEPEDEQFAAALRNLRQNEARTRIVLATAGAENVSQANSNLLVDTPAFSFAETIPLSPTIRETADYLGFTNTIPDVDSIVRRQPSLIQSNSGDGYTFSVATYLAYLRIPNAAAEQVITIEEDRLFITNEREIPIDEFGFWRPYFFGQPANRAFNTFPIISFVDVASGDFDATIFDDRIVLIGLMENTALLDQYLVPSSTNGTLMAGVEIQAHAVQSILSSRFPTLVTPGLQAVLIFLSAVSAGVLYALPRWYFKVTLLIVLLLIWFIVASVIFSMTYQMTSLFDISLALSLTFVSSLGIDITLERRERQRTQALLTSVQNIAEQELRLEQAAKYILQDIRHLVPQGSIHLYVRDASKSDATFAYQQSALNGKIASETLSTSIEQIKLTHARVFPLTWSQELQGVIAVESKGILSARTSTAIEHLLEQLAPHIANLLLFQVVEYQRSLLDAVIAETPTAIAIVDSEQQIIQHNRELATVIGAGMSDLQGLSMVELVLNTLNDDAKIDIIKNNFATEKMFSLTELKVGEFAYNLNAAKISYADIWVVIFNDVTSLVELSNLKTQMLRIAAHDLKNPLARIMGFTELLQMQLEVNERQEQYLDFILKGSQEMLSIITDILNLERLRSGKLNPETVDLTRLVEEVSSSYQPDYIQKQQDFALSVPDHPLLVKADLGQLSQAISNLIGNAIKYTPNEGRVMVRLSSENAFIRFEVEDTGYGIPQAAQAKLFTEFYRAKTAQTAHIAGTGLGLSLVKSVIEAHDGNIGFESEESVGSTFYFTLPKVREEQPNA